MATSNNPSHFDEINFIDILFILKNHWRLLCSITVVVTLLTSLFIFHIFIQPPPRFNYNQTLQLFSHYDVPQYLTEGDLNLTETIRSFQSIHTIKMDIKKIYIPAFVQYYNLKHNRLLNLDEIKYSMQTDNIAKLYFSAVATKKNVTIFKELNQYIATQVLSKQRLLKDTYTRNMQARIDGLKRQIAILEKGDKHINDVLFLKSRVTQLHRAVSSITPGELTNIIANPTPYRKSLLVMKFALTVFMGLFVAIMITLFWQKVSTQMRKLNNNL